MKPRNPLAGSLAAATFLVAASAWAGTPGYYISGDAGASLLPDLHFNDTTSGTHREDFDTGIAAGGALGYDTGEGLRFELDSQYQNSQLTRLGGQPATGHISSTSLTANATIDILRDAPITPYVGAGLGIQNVGGTVNGDRGRAWKPAYQARAGLRDDLTDQLSMFGEYRFGQSESVKLAAPTDVGHQHFSDHLLMAGLSYKFAQ
jgi:opacity protein-like surface antigen